MLYLDLAIYLHSLSAETKIIIFQLSFLTFEILYFFWLRKYFNEEEKRIREYYRQSRQKEIITIPEGIVKTPGVLEKLNQQKKIKRGKAPFLLL